MASQMHQDNFGVQAGQAYSLNTKHPVPAASETATYKIPTGYLLSAPPTGVTDNADGTYTVDETYALAPIEFVSDGSVAHEVSDSGGATIAANTADQAALAGV